MKIQCFCFEEQKLDPGETVDMPVLFYLDPEIVNDKYCKQIDNLMLSYTFFRTDEANK
jgi:cytochrome c oxidase assembly protein subunit 11